MGETPSKCPWLPAIAITSEKLAFDRVFQCFSVFLGVGEILFCGGVRVRIFQKYFPEIFFTTGKIFYGFFSCR